MRKFAAIFALVFTAPLLAEPPKLVIPPEVRPAGDYIRFTPDTDAVSVTYIGLSGIDPFPSEELKDVRRFLLQVRGLPEGRYKFAAIGASKDGEQTRTDFEAVVGAPGPGPGPSPPGPTPPGPGPGPAPIPVDGMRVLVVLESAELSDLPAAQHTALYSQAVRRYLNSKCAKVGNTAEWRIWDKDIDVSGTADYWQNAMKRKRGKLPWIIISTGKAGYEGPLPATEADLLDLLKKYGG